MPIFKLHLLDAVSSSFLLMPRGSKGRPIVSRFSFYNHTWTYNIRILVFCSSALSGGRSQDVCEVSVSAHTDTNKQQHKCLLWHDQMQMILFRCAERMNNQLFVRCAWRRDDTEATLWGGRCQLQWWREFAIGIIKWVLINIVGCKCCQNILSIFPQ